MYRNMRPASQRAWLMPWQAGVRNAWANQNSSLSRQAQTGEAVAMHRCGHLPVVVSEHIGRGVTLCEAELDHHGAKLLLPTIRCIHRPAHVPE